MSACVNNRVSIFHRIASVIFAGPIEPFDKNGAFFFLSARVVFLLLLARPYTKCGRNVGRACCSARHVTQDRPSDGETSVTCVLSFNFSRETRFGDAPVMCRMRETDNGSVPAERFGPCMARRVRALLRLQNHAAGQVLLQGSEALLQERLLQVCARALFSAGEKLSFPPTIPSINRTKHRQ